ncbi:hypothetical protein TrVFT333_006481 [Trichoderma virens FT-333]|nr:hypothetical protein TrVFT333_006481 [Trichoderma virens FT-333]
MNPTELPVENIGYSQDSIGSTFSNGQRLEDVIFSLRSMSPQSRIEAIKKFPIIRVVEFQSQGWITLDNRRLKVFKDALEGDAQTSVPVQVPSFCVAVEHLHKNGKLTTKNEGEIKES